MRKYAQLLLLGCCMLLLCACGAEQPVEEPAETSVAIAPLPSVTDYHLRDNDYLYQEQDRTSVVTMYLTIGTGNSEEGTDHTWQEINSLDNYYYSEHNIPRYQVSALLHVGDENGPLKGEVGFG